MRRKLLGAFAGMLAGTSLALGQPQDLPRLPEPAGPAEALPRLPEPAVPTRPVVTEEQVPAQVPVEAMPVEVVPPGGDLPDAGSLLLDGPAARHEHLWFSAEYLLWWFKGQQPPPLVTTGPPATVAVTGPPAATVAAPGVGAIGAPGTQVLFGGREIDDQARSGGRFTGGFWLDRAHHWAVEGNYFFIGERSNDSLFGPEIGVLARPFFNLNTGAEDAALVTFPGESRGSLVVSTPSRLWGAEGDVLKTLCACDYQYHVSWLTGFRFLDLQEDISLTQSQGLNAGLPPTAPFFPLAGRQLVLSDRFATENQFYGGQFGLDAGWCLGPWSLDVRGKLGLGDTHETLTVLGTQASTPPGGTTTVTPGGLLALPSNSGRFTRNTFALVPEAAVHIRCHVCDHISLFAGYDFLYWSRVVRPGDQIDRVLDVSQAANFAPGATATGLGRPAGQVKEADFWAQGLDVGLEFVW